MEQMVTSGLKKGQVGIQFISFGDDEEGLRRLDELDEYNKELRMELYVFNRTFSYTCVVSDSLCCSDIVDTVKSTGSIWKMLLGAIHPYLDGDPPPTSMQPLHSRAGRSSDMTSSP